MKRLLSLVAVAAFVGLFLPFGQGACKSACTGHEQCEDGEVCVFTSGTCAKKCDASKTGACASGLSCDGCATSSCSGCKDCQAACIQPSGGNGGPAGGW